LPAEALYIAFFAAVIINIYFPVPLIWIRFLPITILKLTSIILRLQILFILSFYKVVGLKSASIIEAKFNFMFFIIGFLFFLIFLI